MLSLTITGFDADPDQVSEILGLVPTQVARKGDVGVSGRPRTFSGWWHDVHEAPVTDGGAHDAALNRILTQLRGREERFAALRRLVKPQQVAIYGGFHLAADSQAGVWLGVDQMRLLVACGIEWGMELFGADPAG